MKAMRIDRHGGPEVLNLKDVELPDPRWRCSRWTPNPREHIPEERRSK